MRKLPHTFLLASVCWLLAAAAAPALTFTSTPTTVTVVEDTNRVLTSGSLASGTEYQVILTVTNNATNNCSLTINGWTRLFAASPTASQFATGATVNATASNVVLGILANPYTNSTFVVLPSPATNQVKIISHATTFTVAITGGWGSASITTNSTLTAWLPRVPFNSIGNALLATNEANLLIRSLNEYATGANGTGILSNRIVDTAGLTNGLNTAVSALVTATNALQTQITSATNALDNATNNINGQITTATNALANATNNLASQITAATNALYNATNSMLTIAVTNGEPASITPQMLTNLFQGANTTGLVTVAAASGLFLRDDGTFAAPAATATNIVTAGANGTNTSTTWIQFATGFTNVVSGNTQMVYATSSGSGYGESVRAYHNVATNSSNGAWFTIPFNSERYDSDAFHDTGSNTSRLTVPTGKDGKYLIVGNVEFDTNTTGLRYCRILLNGATQIALNYLDPGVATSTPQFNISTIYSLAAADYVELQVYQSSGGALAVNASANYSPEFMMTRIGP